MATVSQQKWQMAGRAISNKWRDIDVMAKQLIQLQKERDELQKDVEILCMQQAGFSSGFDIAQKINNRRAVGLEQELTEIKHQMNVISKEKDLLEEEIEIAYRGKDQIQESLKEATERVASLESEIKYFQQQVTEVHVQRDKALMELETVRFEQESMEEAMKELYARQRQLETQMADEQNETLSLKGRLEIANVAIDEMHKVAVTTEVNRALEEERGECKHAKGGISKVLEAEKERIARMRLELLQAFQEMRELHTHEKIGRIQLEEKLKEQEDYFTQAQEELEQKLSTLEKESANKIEDLESALETEREDREKEKGELIEIWETEQEMRQEMNRKLREVEAEVERLKEEFEAERREREKETEELEEKLDSKRQNCEVLEKVMAELSQKLLDEKMEKEDVQNQLEEERTAREDIEGKAGAVQAEAEKKIRELQVAIDMKEQQGRRHRQDLEARAKELESQVKDMQIRSREMKEDETKLQEELRKFWLHQKKWEESEGRMREEQNEMQASRNILERRLEEALKELELEKAKANQRETSTGEPNKEQLDKFEEQKRALAQAMNEKVATLQVLSKHEERQRIDATRISELEEDMKSLQEKLRQVTKEKIDALMEVANLKQQREALQDQVKDQMHHIQMQRSASAASMSAQPGSPLTTAIPRDIPPGGEVPPSYGGQGAQQMANAASFMGVIRRSGWFKSPSMKRDGPALSNSASFRRSGSMTSTGDEPGSRGETPNPTN